MKRHITKDAILPGRICADTVLSESSHQFSDKKTKKSVHNARPPLLLCTASTTFSELGTKQKDKEGYLTVRC